MKTLTKEIFEALRYAYNQGWIDVHEGENHFSDVIEFWFNNAEEDGDEDE